MVVFVFAVVAGVIHDLLRHFFGFQISSLEKRCKKKSLSTKKMFYKISSKVIFASLCDGFVCVYIRVSLSGEDMLFWDYLIVHQVQQLPFRRRMVGECACQECLVGVGLPLVVVVVADDRRVVACSGFVDVGYFFHLFGHFFLGLTGLELLSLYRGQRDRIQAEASSSLVIESIHLNEHDLHSAPVSEQPAVLFLHL